MKTLRINSEVLAIEMYKFNKKSPYILRLKVFGIDRSQMKIWIPITVSHILFM